MGRSDAQVGTAAPARRMRRADRREQILDAATRAFARTGYAATSLDDIADEAAVTRVILYRHFESKNAMYRAVLERAGARLASAVGTEGFDDRSITALLSAAAADPDGFRLMFRHAMREPEFSDITDALSATSVDAAHRALAVQIGDDRWAGWAARVVPAMAIESVIAWLDTGQPDGVDAAAARIGGAIHGVIAAAQRD